MFTVVWDNLLIIFVPETKASTGDFFIDSEEFGVVHLICVRTICKEFTMRYGLLENQVSSSRFCVNLFVYWHFKMKFLEVCVESLWEYRANPYWIWASTAWVIDPCFWLQLYLLGSAQPTDISTTQILSNSALNDRSLIGKFSLMPLKVLKKFHRAELQSDWHRIEKRILDSLHWDCTPALSMST